MAHLRYGLLLSAARDLGRVDSAYHAELLVSTLLGSVYSVAETDRAAVVEQFTAGFTRFLRTAGDENATLVLAVLESFVAPSEQEITAAGSGLSGSGTAGSGTARPAWTRRPGTAKLSATFAYGDAYGDQVNYLATFSYPDAQLGGPEHVVSFLIDRNLGVIKDLFVAAPAETVLEQLRASVDDATIFTTIEPAILRAAVARYLPATDALPSVQDDGSFAADRAVGLARLALLPEGPGQPDTPGQAATPGQSAEASDDLARFVEGFRGSPEADRLIGAPGDAPALEFCLDLLGRYAASTLEKDPLRWSPTAVRLFLLDWVPSNAILDNTDLALLPKVLDAWVRWTGRIRDLPPRLVAETVVAIARVRLDFVERTRSGKLRSPEAKAAAQLLTDGIDLDDEEAVGRWLVEYNARTDSPSSDVQP